LVNSTPTIGSPIRSSSFTPRQAHRAECTYARCCAL
jgi:hypothetical protein